MTAPFSTRSTPLLATLYFYLSSYCNLRCRHCWLDPLHTTKRYAPNEAPLQMLQNIIDQAIPLGLMTIKISGGEPLLSRAALPLIRLASQKGLNIILETNATLIDKKIAHFLKTHAVRFVAVSLDSDQPATHDRLRGQKGSFQAALKGLRFLTKLGINTQVIMSVCADNLERLTYTIALAERYGARSFKINPVMRIGRGEHLEKMGMALSVKDCIRLQKCIATVIQPRHKISVTLAIPQAFKELKYALAGKRSCRIHNILGVLPDGSFSICGIGQIMSPLRLGNITEKSLTEIWKNNPVLKQIRRDVPYNLQGVCGICIFKGFCLGFCRAESYYSNGNLVAPFWFCKEAHAQGLFPAKLLYRKKTATS